MSPRDVVAELRAARVEAPPELRARVRLIGSQAAPPRRRVSWWLAVAVALPVAAALAGGIVLATRPSHHAAQPQVLERGVVAHGAYARPQLRAPQPSQKRIQRYNAWLTLRVGDVTAVSNGVKRALGIAASLGGYPVSVHVVSTTPQSSANLVLKIPRTHVQQAIARLSRLGTITAEQVALQDLQAGINTTDRTIARLQKQLAALRAQPQTDVTARKIAALTAHVEALQRARASTIRAAHFATVSLGFTTEAPAPTTHGHGPLHGLVVAFRWIGIGLVYALALGIPATALVLAVWLAVRTVRRRREDALLNG